MSVYNLGYSGSFMLWYQFPEFGFWKPSSISYSAYWENTQCVKWDGRGLPDYGLEMKLTKAFWQKNANKKTCIFFPLEKICFSVGKLFEMLCTGECRGDSKGLKRHMSEVFMIQF